MSSTNKHGLSRNIPSEIKRMVRKRCGYGCVICGFAIYQYHHFDPPFKDAKKHDPKKIILLCGSHHDLYGKGRLSDITIQRYNEKPKCMELGFSFGPFDIGNIHPNVILGPTTCVNTSRILEIYGTDILRIDPPDENGAPFSLSGIFCDDEGNEIFRIIKNEWLGSINNWDIEITGNAITIRRDLRKIALKIVSRPPQDLVIEVIDMKFRDVQIKGKIGSVFEISLPNKRLILKNATFKNLRGAIRIN
ncbi:MAG: HNH endonuclease signature motif containing protein [Promethearchaeota archaeon]|jgi:hypothetical protein